MKPKELAKLKDDCIAYNKKWSESKKPLKIYDCPCCGKPIQTPMPTRKLVDSRGYWDSLTTCYECGDVYFIVKYPASVMYPTGEILIKEIQPF